MLGIWDESGPVIHINMERKPVKTKGGHVLAAPGKSKQNIQADLRLSGNVADVSFQIRLGEGSNPIARDREDCLFVACLFSSIRGVDG